MNIYWCLQFPSSSDLLCCASDNKESCICVVQSFSNWYWCKKYFECTLWMFRPSCCRWWLRIILMSSKHFSCSVFFLGGRFCFVLFVLLFFGFFSVSPEYINTPLLLDLKIYREKTTCGCSQHNFQRSCPPTLYQGWDLEIAGYLFILVLISFHFSVWFWDLSEGAQGCRWAPYFLQRHSWWMRAVVCLPA